MPVIVSSAVRLPERWYDQRSLAEAGARILGLEAGRGRTLERFFRRVGVNGRHLALPLEAYERLDDFEARNGAWLETAVDLGGRAVEAALGESGVPADDLAFFVSTTVTGVAVPSLDARITNRLRLPAHLARVPLFGLGCLGGAAGLARVRDLLAARPEAAAVLLAVEICSLTFQHDDPSVANLISSGLFGDGAAALVVVGDRHPLAETPGAVCVEDSRAVLFPDTERVMGWDVVAGGFKVVLSPDVPRLAREALPGEVAALLAPHGLEAADVASWVAHPGGPKVIAGMQEGLGLPEDAFEVTWQSLAERGNLSSASVLDVFDRFRRHRRPAPGAPGVLMAMGPGFSAELVLLRW